MPEIVIVPLLTIGLPSTTTKPLLVTAAAAETVRVPLPENVPLLHVIDAPVTLTLPLPESVPPFMVSDGSDCAEALLIANVPPVRMVFAEIVPAKAWVLFCTENVPLPEIVDAESNVALP